MLSGIVNAWLPLKTTDSLFAYTWNVGRYQAGFLSASTLVVPHSSNATKVLVKGRHFKQPDPNYLKYGVGANQQEDGMVKVVVEFAK